MLGMIRTAYAYRGFIVSSVRNDIVMRFARSRLGALWTFIHPLSQVLIYTVILANILSARMPGISGQYDYALYLLAGFIPWALFSEVLQRSVGVFIEFGPLMQKVVLPKICLPIIVALTALWNSLVMTGLTLIAYLLVGRNPSLLDLLWLVVLLGITAVFATGLGLIFGILNVFFRDVGQIVPIVLQFLFWLTPIVYAVSIIPEGYRHWFDYNPLATLVEAYHAVLLFDTPPDIGALAVVALIGVVSLILSLVLLRRANQDMVDVL